MHSVIPASFVSQASRRNSTERERNIIAAIFSAKVIVLLIMALALPNWYYLKGGGCTRQVLGTEQFFYVSSVGTLTVPADGGNISYSKLAYYGLNEDMKDCLTPEIVAVQRIIIGLCFITIFFSFSQFYFDISGVKNNSLKCTRRCGLGSILSGDEIIHSDNGPIHAMGLVQWLFDELEDDVKHLHWPAQFPDLNMLHPELISCTTISPLNFHNIFMKNGTIFL
ncbi:transmembrane protein 127-like isoform X2 [Argiope bruennichi]|uniref:transmembrane protein 127-like isoform X2 n=1 Tax=Argiope bruennichi TaxID=94029 RepID=UPI0024956FD1|nr:transmembrane protein 127-like isoform X2 [Argiope bruennichi]